MMQREPVSLWDASADEADIVSPMTGDESTDLAIIGAGFTGLSTALHAAEAGIGCHVIEARNVAFGGSGRNVGLVNAGLWLPPQDVRARMGEAQGAALIELLGKAPDVVYSLIEKHQMQCEATRNGTIHAAHSPRGQADLARRAGEWARLGAPVELLDRAAVAGKTGTSAFFGGLEDRRAGTVNPMGYARGLARAARAAGAQISTGTRVTGLHREGGQWRLRTAAGTLSARHVVLGTNAYSDDLWPGLRRSYTMIHFFQLATPPLGDEGAHILPGGQGLWDTAPIMFSLRRDAAGRLIIGSMGALLGGTGGLSRRWAAKRLRRLYPELGPVEFESGWHGQIAMTPDHLPRIHRLAEGLYSAIGYNGRGIAPGTVFGRALAGLIAGGSEADLPMPPSALTPVPARTLMTGFYHTAFAVNQLIRGI
ncbi:MAG: NAD(P)/FAD-dependent oxidoreductase [Jhaorihella sp.]